MILPDLVNPKDVVDGAVRVLDVRVRRGEVPKGLVASAVRVVIREEIQIIWMDFRKGEARSEAAIDLVQLGLAPEDPSW